jgi:hypothetical protein
MRLKNNKRGISAVVATVLIILITVAAVAIIWTTIIPLIKNSLSEIDVSQIDLKIDTSSGFTAYDTATGIGSVKITKGANDDYELVGIKVFLENSEGTSESYEVDFDISTGSKTFYFETAEEPSSISIAPIILDGKTERIGDIIYTAELKAGSISEIPEGANTLGEIQVPAECSIDPDCINDENPCTAHTCNSGICESTDMADGSYCGVGLWCQSIVCVPVEEPPLGDIGDSCGIGSDCQSGVCYDTFCVECSTFSDCDVGYACDVGNSCALDTTLVGMWGFEGGSGTTAVDESANSNDGTIVGGVISGSAKVGSYTLALDGTDDYVDLNSNSVIPSSGPVTVSAWIKNSGVSDDGDSPWFKKGSTNGYGLYIRDLKIYVITYGVSNWDTGYTITQGTWYHVVFTFDGTDKKIWVNGNLAATEENSGYGDASEQSFIGRIITGGETGYFKGAIDAVRVYDRALGEDEILHIYNTQN